MHAYTRLYKHCSICSQECQVFYYAHSIGPTVATLRDFCQMIWDVRTTMVVMVTKVVEGTKVRSKQLISVYTLYD